MKQAACVFRSSALMALAGLSISAPAAGQEAASQELQAGLTRPLSLEEELNDPAMQTALAVLEAAPVFDGHNDVPFQLRRRLANQINRFDFNDTSGGAMSDPFSRAMQTDLKRLRKRRVGAQCWSVYVPANLPEAQAMKMTMEQIDVTKRPNDRFPDDLACAQTADDGEQAMPHGRSAGLSGMEGGHSIGSDLGVLCQMCALGAP